MIRRTVLVAPLLLAVLGVSAAHTQGTEPVYPTLTQPVTDVANVIDAESAATLDQRLRALRAATNDVMAIVTVPTTEPAASIEEYAVKLFERAGIGNRSLDNGILILVAVKEKGIRIEVGYGLESIVTDGYAGDTIRQAIVPEFKNGRYGPGLVAGATRLIQKISEGRKTEVAGIPPADTARPAWVPLVIGFGGVALVLVLFAVFGRRRSRHFSASSASPSAAAAWIASQTPAAPDDDRRRSSNDSSSSDSSSSSSSSDSGGFDGGSSGGGGASGSW